MDQNSLKKSFPVILKDEETGERTILTEDGQRRVNSEDDTNDTPNFDLPQEVTQTEDSEVTPPEEMEDTVEGIMNELFSDDGNNNRVEEKKKAADPMERWIAPTIGEGTSGSSSNLGSDGSLRLSENNIRGLIQQEIRKIFEGRVNEASGDVYHYEPLSHPNAEKWKFDTPNYTLTTMVNLNSGGDIRMPPGSGDYTYVSMKLSERGRRTKLNNGPIENPDKVISTFLHLSRKGYEKLGTEPHMIKVGGGVFDTLEIPVRRVVKAFPEIEEVGQRFGDPVFFLDEIPESERRDGGRYDRLY